MFLLIDTLWYFIIEKLERLYLWDPFKWFVFSVIQFKIIVLKNHIGIKQLKPQPAHFELWITAVGERRGSPAGWPWSCRSAQVKKHWVPTDLEGHHPENYQEVKEKHDLWSGILNNVDSTLSMHSHLTMSDFLFQWTETEKYVSNHQSAAAYR